MFSYKSLSFFIIKEKVISFRMKTYHLLAAKDAFVLTTDNNEFHNNNQIIGIVVYSN